jgi:hypothetical protein
MGGVAVQNRVVVEGEHLAVHLFPSGLVGLASEADLRRDTSAGRERSSSSIWHRIKRRFQPDRSGCSPPIREVFVPSGTHLILKAIPMSPAFSRSDRVPSAAAAGFARA